MAPNEPTGERTLSDGVVVLDRFRLDGAQAQLAGEDEEHARRSGWYPARSTLETVRTAILGWQEQWRTGGPTRAFAVRDAYTGELVGGCEVRLRGGGLARMSYWTFPAHRGRALASRAVCLACSYAFRELGVKRMDLHIAADNVASRGVARRAGFTEENLVPPEGEEVGERRRRCSAITALRHSPEPWKPAGRSDALPVPGVSCEARATLLPCAGCARAARMRWWRCPYGLSSPRCGTAPASASSWTARSCRNACSRPRI